MCQMVHYHIIWTLKGEIINPWTRILQFSQLSIFKYRFDHQELDSSAHVSSSPFIITPLSLLFHCYHYYLNYQHHHHHHQQHHFVLPFIYYYLVIKINMYLNPLNHLTIMSLHPLHYQDQFKCFPIKQMIFEKLLITAFGGTLPGFVITARARDT